MSLPSLEERFLDYLETLKSEPERLKAIDQFNNSKAFRDQFLKIDSLDPERNVKATPESLKAHEAYRKTGVGKVPEMLKTGEETALKEMPLGTQANSGSNTSTPKPTSKYAGTRAYQAGVKAGQAKAAVRQAASKVATNVPQYVKNGLSTLSDLRIPAGLGGAAAGAGFFFAPIMDAQERLERGGYEGTNPMIPFGQNQVYDEETGQTFDIPNAGLPDEVYHREDDPEASSEYHPEPAPMVPLDDTNQASPVVQESAPLVSNPLSNLNELSAADLATAVIRGKYGNGDARRKALGDRYAEVQALVNQRMQGARPVTKVTPTYSVESPRRADRMIRPMTIGEAYQRDMGNFTVLPDEPNKYIK